MKQLPHIFNNKSNQSKYIPVLFNIVKYIVFLKSKENIFSTIGVIFYSSNSIAHLFFNY